MWPFRSSRAFREVVDRQLSIFSADHDELVTGARAARAAYARETDPAAAQDAYAEHDELAERVEELLDDMYRSYAGTLEADMRRRYRRMFARRAKATYGDLLPRLTFDSDDDKLPE
jgi:hypothetical protein